MFRTGLDGENFAEIKLSVWRVFSPADWIRSTNMKMVPVDSKTSE